MQLGIFSLGMKIWQIVENCLPELVCDNVCQSKHKLGTQATPGSAYRRASNLALGAHGEYGCICVWQWLRAELYFMVTADNGAMGPQVNRWAVDTFEPTQGSWCYATWVLLQVFYTHIRQARPRRDGRSFATNLCRWAVCLDMFLMAYTYALYTCPFTKLKPGKPKSHPAGEQFTTLHPAMYNAPSWSSKTNPGPMPGEHQGELSWMQRLTMRAALAQGKDVLLLLELAAQVRGRPCNLGWGIHLRGAGCCASSSALRFLAIWFWFFPRAPAKGSS